MKHRIIIFSSKEQLPLAELLQTKLYYRDFSVEIWTNGFFELSKSYIENFTNLRLHYDFALVIFNDDDCIIRNGEKFYIARDNVILELGMCIEAFSLKNTIIVKKDKSRLPTDLSGIQPIEFSLNSDDNINAVAGTIAAKVSSYIKTYSSRDDILSWDELFLNTSKIIKTLHKSESMGGYYFDILVGINRGGMIIADLIAREFGQNKPIVSLFADRSSGGPVFDNSSFIIDNKNIIEILQNKHINNILLVDSYARSGDSIVAAKKYLMDNLPDKRIKTAVIYVNKKLENNEVLNHIDIFSCYKELDGKHLSLSRYESYEL